MTDESNPSTLSGATTAGGGVLSDDMEYGDGATLRV